MMGKVDLAARILGLASDGRSLKTVEERSGLSHKELEDNLKVLISKDLIMSDEKKISITKRGVQFLNLYNSIHSKYLKVSV
jgi:predicted transcriptional regulator